MGPSPIGALVRFARAATESPSPDVALSALAAAIVEECGVDGAAVVCVASDGSARLVSTNGLPVDEGRLELDTLGPELAHELERRCGSGKVHLLPLVTGGDLLGAAALWVKDGGALTPEAAELARGLVDVAAVAQRLTHKVEALSKSNAELRAAREVLDRADRLAALGQMAAGIAHDLANVLSPLVTDVENLRAAPPTERAGRAAERMSRYLRVGRDLLERLRRFARQSPEVGHLAIDPTGPVKDAVDLCQARATERRIELRFAPGPAPAVVVSPSDLTSAVVNLIVNAVEVQEGGAVEVRVGPAPGGGALLEVQDQGPGIPAELQPRIFEPFFSTKGERGTGLGLANVYAFAQRHRGRACFTTAAGQGTTFRLEFPAPQPASA